MHVRLSSPESRAAQARMAVLNRQAARAATTVSEVEHKVAAGTATEDQLRVARSRAEELLSEAEQARAIFEGERALAQVEAALFGRTVPLTRDQAERLRTMLTTATESIS